MGALVGGTIWSARRWISAGWWCPPAPLQTHPARDPGPISVPGSSLAQLHPPAWGAAVVSPGHPHIETRDMDAGLTHSKAAGRHGRGNHRDAPLGPSRGPRGIPSPSSRRCRLAGSTYKWGSGFEKSERPEDLTALFAMTEFSNLCPRPHKPTVECILLYRVFSGTAHGGIANGD